ncbi:MAG: hypothetical protein A4E28_01070 [Methanocella sp. PtaU1.Bin125]|nr:MAG: hypothetical protein A4E28_01070 [Methanocella sp. PtaU1.Bin125]
MSGVRIVVTAYRFSRVLILLSALVLCLMAVVPACASAECTVKGNIYDWSTFDQVSNAIVEVYSLPDLSLAGQQVIKSGSYSFSLPQGSYMIKASSGPPGTPDEIQATENVTVPATGELIIDLIMFPGSLDDLSGYVEDNSTATPSPAGIPTTGPETTPGPAGTGWLLYLGAGAMILAIGAIVAGLVFLRRDKPKPPVEPPSVKEAPAAASFPPAVPVMPPEEPVQEQERMEQMPETETPSLSEPQSSQQPQQPQLTQQPQQMPPSAQELLLPQDCREVLAIMEKNGGRITQLDLRKALPYSEAKVSLIVSDLESRGLVKKIKKGRGNVLILNRPGERPPD